MSSNPFGAFHTRTGHGKLQLFPFASWMRQLDGKTLKADLIAGLTGTVMVLPQGVAYALIAGMPAEYGLYSAIVVAVIAALFGSSRHMVSGPAAAMSIMILGVVSPLAQPGSESFIALVLTLTLMVGVMQCLCALLHAGKLVNLISHTVVVGFTSGAAILIATSQIHHLLGVSAAEASNLIQQWQALLSSGPDANGLSIMIGLTTIVVTLVVKRTMPTLPNMLLGLLAGTLICLAFDGSSQGVAMVGALPGHWPQWSLTDISWSQMQILLPGAIAVTILGLVEAAAISRSIAIRSGQALNANQEFLGQGLANLVGSLFSGFAGSGSFTRSGVNYQAGARSPMAVVFAAVLLALVLVCMPDITHWLPLPAMAGSILLIAWNLLGFKELRRIAASGSREKTVLVVTLVATLALPLDFAILIGVVVSLMVYLDRSAHPPVVEIAPISARPAPEFRNVNRLGLAQCPALRILRIDGSVYFGSVEHIREQLQHHRDQSPQIKHWLIIGTGIHYIDFAGADLLVNEFHQAQHRNQTLNFCWLTHLVRQQPDAHRLIQEIGQHVFHDSVDQAITHLIEQINLHGQHCQQCSKKIFAQCPGQSPDIHNPDSHSGNIQLLNLTSTTGG